MKKLLGSLAILLASPLVYSATGCGTLTVKEFYIQAERPTSAHFSNTVVLRLSDENGAWINCASKPHAYIENSAPAYDSIVAVLLTAKTTQAQISLIVDENTVQGSANRIEMLYLKP